jgi:hypothetical protein
MLRVLSIRRYRYSFRVPDLWIFLSMWPCFCCICDGFGGGCRFDMPMQFTPTQTEIRYLRSQTLACTARQVKMGPPTLQSTLTVVSRLNTD